MPQLPIEDDYLDVIRAEANAKRKATYPADHKPAMRVPKGGSSCASCKYLGGDGESCTNRHFIQWNGRDVLPAPADSYCSDWYEPERKD